MHLLYNLGKYSVRLNPETKRLEIEDRKEPMLYPQAGQACRRERPRSERDGFLRHAPPDNAYLYDFSR